ncbi:DUF930 domain-containing protein [Roseibium suaedae]|uniref:DUF930 domain-containing protein n=1 Tax=Roseibium suaedae TaxID=735517 RepID=A0A1M7HF92_9HYPH|nr:DUF930 domain-containing protein [Roseibium suaedae]SHM27156.1 protein of unknown function [Roseibium suaedae]
MISLVLHGLVAAALLTKVDWQLPDMREEQQTVDVVLVPEPEPEPQPQPEEEAAPEPEPQPEPEPEPEQPQAEEEAAPQPEPEPEPAPQAEEMQEPEAQQVEPQQPLPVLQPVYEYADKDNGSEQAQDGAEEPSEQETEVAQEPEEQAEPKGEETAEAEQSETPEVTETPEEPETAEAENVPEVQEEVQEAEGLAAGPEAQAEASPEEQAIPAGPEPSDVAPSDFGTVGPIASLSAPPPKPAKPKGVPGGTSGNLIKARKIFSDSLSDDPRAWTAMAGMGRNERANMLCMTELRDQLRRASPPWQPEVLPILHLGSGTVVQNDRVAFFAAGQWYDLSVRCEVNNSVTRVLDFGYRVGAPVPRSQWRQRKFPEL